MAETDGYLRTGAIEDAMRTAQGNLARMGELQETLASLVGVAESDDGRVRAECDNASGLKKLTIDPRAMRMGSEELSGTITKVVAEAMADLRRQSQEAAQRVMGGKKRDLKDAKASIDQARESFDRIAVDAQSEMERLKRRLNDLTSDLTRG
jgi:DNA-binding protein YbaB